MNLNFIGWFSPAIFEIIFAGVFIVGLVLILKEKRISTLSKILWILFLLLFNFIALICFLIWIQSKSQRNSSINT